MLDGDDEITWALTQAVTADDVARVLATAEETRAGLEAQVDELELQALSPLLTMAEAMAKRDEALHTRFVQDRFDAGCSALRARVRDLRDEEERTARLAEKEQALLERDELASDLAERYPAIVRELTSLVKRIAASEARCQPFGIESAEAIGRNLPASFHDGRGPVLRLSMTNLPMPSTHETAWGTATVGGSTIWRGLDA